MTTATILFGLLSLQVGQPANGSDNARDDGKFALPSDPNAWINSPPLDLEALKGKGVFLWFYEET